MLNPGTAAEESIELFCDVESTKLLGSLIMLSGDLNGAYYISNEPDDNSCRPSPVRFTALWGFGYCS